MIDTSAENEVPVTWDVVATVAEPVPLVLAFAAHHLESGAGTVHLYVDDPDDPVAELLEGLPGLRVCRCNSRHWRRVGAAKRPDTVKRRQGVNATDAARHSSAAFLLHCDADEFLVQGHQVRAQLQRLPAEVMWLKVPNLERCFRAGQRPTGLFGGVFRHAIGAPHATARPDDLPEDILRHAAFIGHDSGKALSRIAPDMAIGIHAPRYGAPHLRDIPPARRARKMRLLHLDGLSPLHFARKLLRLAALGPIGARAIVPPHRMIEVARLAVAPCDTAVYERAFDAAFGVPDPAMQVLTDRGIIETQRFNPGAALRRRWPDVDLDLSMAAMDAALTAEVTALHAQAQLHRGLWQRALADMERAGDIPRP